MKTKSIVAGCMLISVSLFGGSDSKLVKSKVDSIGLFKNGLAVVKRSFKINGDGLYMIEDVPEPVHGTFWIESDAEVITRVTKKEFEVEENRSRMSLDETLTGHDVKIHLKENKVVVSGTVIADNNIPEKMRWDRDFNPTYSWYNNYNNRNRNIPVAQSRFLTLKTDSGMTMVDASQIIFVESTKINSKVKREKPVLIFDVKNAKKKSSIQISYLTKGISWAPSYRIDLESDEKLKIQQKAIIKNELMDFTDTEIHLISGFPNVKFANATSPMSLDTTWSSFFQQLSQQNSSYNNTRGQMLTQQAVMYNSAPVRSSGIDPNSMGKSEGVDLHYQNAGIMSLDEGDSLAFSVDGKTAGYESIVQWDISDNRNEYGQYVRNHNRRNNSAKFQDNLWDSIRFKNPFKFPMTTAAAITCRDNKFLGQTLSYWVNPSAETILHVTKALSLRAQDRENEVKGKREVVYVSGDDYQKSKIEGKLLIHNYRKTAVKLLINKSFSGKLVSADEKPECKLKPEGVFSINERNDLVWEITLKPGESKTINYIYTVLVNI